MRRPTARRALLLAMALLLPHSAIAASAIQERADRFLTLVNAGYQSLLRVKNEEE
jgi:hypothetical protein